MTTDLLYLTDKSATTNSAELRKAIKQRTKDDQLLAFITTDGANAQTKAISELKTDNWICVCHTINLIVREFYQSDKIRKYVENPLKICQKISAHNYLSKQLEGKTILMPNDTRWNGMHRSLERFLKIQETLKEIYDNNQQFFDDVDFPNKEELKSLDFVCQLLGSFDKASVVLQGDSYPTLNLVCYEVNLLFKAVEQDAENNTGKEQEIKRAMESILCRRLKDVFTTPNYALLAARITPAFYDIPFPLVPTTVIDSLDEALILECTTIEGNEDHQKTMEGNIKDLPLAIKRFNSTMEKFTTSKQAAEQSILFWKTNPLFTSLHPVVKALLSCPASSGIL